MSPPEVSHDARFARLEVRLDHAAQQLAELKRENVDLSVKLDDIRHTLAEARGGWRLLLIVSGLSSAVGGAFVWALKNLTVR